MTTDERLAWIEAWFDAEDPPAPPADDPVLVGAVAVLRRYGCYADPVLSPDEVLALVGTVLDAGT